MNRRAVVRLVRLPALFTAVADPAAGYFLALGDRPIDGPSLAGALLAGAALYAGGMVANDVADAGRDRRLKPDRPIPSGQATRAGAAALAAGLLALGIAAGALASSATVAWAIGLAAVVVAYDFGAKGHLVGGALAMGSARAGNLLLGAVAAGGPLPGAAALALFLYVVALTLSSRFEDAPPTAGERTSMGALHLAAVAIVGAVALGEFAAALPLVALAALLWRAYRHGPPGRIVATGVRGIVLVDAALLIGAGWSGPGFAVACLWFGPRLLTRAATISGMTRE